MERGFSQVDVFTDELTLGNPVAVVHDAAGLTDEQLQGFASWTNLSETTFLLPPIDPTADYRLRIFTTTRELPFAGHPTLGSARAWLSAGGQSRDPGMIVQECPAGLVRIRPDGGRLAFAAPPLLRSGPVAVQDLATIVSGLRVDPADVVDAQWADNGPGWVAVLLRDADTVIGLEPDARALAAWPEIGVVGPYATGELAFEVRAFVGRELAEDPVTGSLNAAIGQWLIGSGRATTSYIASQGIRRGRRGRIYVEQVGADVWVGGDTVLGVRGHVDL